MRVFVAGATGVIGRPLVDQLLEAGHEVTAMTRSPARADILSSRGADGVVCDIYDAKRVETVMARAEPDVVVHQLTSLPKAIHPRKIEDQLAENDRIRVEGTRNLVRAAPSSGAGRIVAQSISFVYAPVGGFAKREDDVLWLDAPWPWRRTVESVVEMERLVGSVDQLDGVVLRYGYFYGPGTAFARDGSTAGRVRARRFPVAGSGSGVFSFVHVGDAASATVLALHEGRPGVYNVVDDEPAPVHEWLPVYAAALGAPPPRRVPGWLARLLAGEYAVYSMTEQRGADSAKAKAELGWMPAFASWREGFSESLRGGGEPETED